ncbi:MAG: hypothetical protein ACE5IL_17920, partial [Myxococcota bacterium]
GGELPPIAELQLLRTAGGAWAVGLSECLRGARIPHRVDSLATEDPRTAGAFGVWVRAEDLEAARAIDLDHARAQVPDIPEGFDASVRDVDAQAGGDDVCPACGGGVAADADECGSCGLYLGQPG